MLPETALSRLVEDDNAPIGARVKALEQLNHPGSVHVASPARRDFEAHEACSFEALGCSDAQIRAGSATTKDPCRDERKEG